MTRSKKIALDCDDVLLDWSGGFKEYIESQTPHRQVITDQTLFSIGSQYGMSTGEGLSWVDKFNHSHQFGLLWATPGAQRAINWLLDDGYDLHIITACGDSQVTKGLRRSNLDRVFGPGTFKEVVFVPCGHSKAEFLYDFDGCYFIDDHVNNVEQAKMLTYSIPILFENFMNRHLLWEGPRINSLVQFYDRFIAEKTNAA